MLFRPAIKAYLLIFFIDVNTNTGKAIISIIPITLVNVSDNSMSMIFVPANIIVAIPIIKRDIHHTMFKLLFFIISPYPVI